MGLVAHNFVRVYHPVTNWNSSATDCDNSTDPSTSGKFNPGSGAGYLDGPQTITIQSAMLALNHSFILDNYFCGNPIGTLFVDGAIAQSFPRAGRHRVGSSSINSGYLKNYSYNDRLRYREPPFFIDPVQSSWRVARQTEQVPAN